MGLPRYAEATDLQQYKARYGLGFKLGFDIKVGRTGRAGLMEEARRHLIGLLGDKPSLVEIMFSLAVVTINSFDEMFKVP